MSLFTELTLTEQASLAGGTNKTVTVKVAKGGDGGKAVAIGGSVSIKFDDKTKFASNIISADGLATGGAGGSATIK